MPMPSPHDVRTCLRGFALLSLLVLPACAAHPPADAAPRPASGAPARFIVDTALQPAVTTGPTCAVHLRPPEGPVRLTLSTSSRIQGVLAGDYSVDPVGSYGVAARERLRVNCESGAPLGIVSR
jgi:hypothetical protein